MGKPPDYRLTSRQKLYTKINDNDNDNNNGNENENENDDDDDDNWITITG